MCFDIFQINLSLGSNGCFLKRIFLQTLHMQPMGVCKNSMCVIYFKTDDVPSRCGWVYYACFGLFGASCFCCCADRLGSACFAVLLLPLCGQALPCPLGGLVSARLWSGFGLSALWSCFGSLVSSCFFWRPTPEVWFFAATCFSAPTWQTDSLCLFLSVRVRKGSSMVDILWH